MATHAFIFFQFLLINQFITTVLFITILIKPFKRLKMKKISTLSTLTVIVITGIMSVNLYLKDYYMISALFTVACIVSISLIINSIKLVDAEKNKVKK